MWKNPQVDIDGPAVTELMACVAATVSRQVAAVSENVYEVILREIPELHDDKAVLALLASSVHSNVGTCLQIMQHQIDAERRGCPGRGLGIRAQAGAARYAADRAAALLPPWAHLLLRLAPQGAVPGRQATPR